MVNNSTKYQQNEQLITTLLKIQVLAWDWSTYLCCHNQKYNRVDNYTNIHKQNVRKRSFVTHIYK
jgi:hypothetical protein